MSQKLVTIEQLKQILQLRNDGIAIREIAHCIGISRNSVREYLTHLETCNENLTNKELADKGYNNDLLEPNTQKQKDLFQRFESTQSELSKTGVTCQLLWKEHL
ncbi:MAG: mobile element protein [Ferruginibacter sp.]|nr:mobile element protein [Ferruginibacter sp.]